MFPFNC